jgi:integrase/recombinase XerD
MSNPTPKISPLRQRMIEDMRIRKLEPKTQSGYIRAVRHFTVWFGRSPDQATAEDLRLFQLHLIDQGVSPITINATQSGLRFFFDITLGQHEVTAKMRPVRVAQRLPVVLSREEATRLIEDRSGSQPQASSGTVGGLWRGSSCQRSGRSSGQ